MTQVPPRNGEGDQPQAGGGARPPNATPEAISPYRPQFEAALRLLARASEAMVARGLPRPILVGGAAAEFYTGSAINTGDFDLCTPWQEELEAEMIRLGFERPSGPGAMTRGLIHKALGFGFEVVADAPMDGVIDPARLRLIQPADDGARLRAISIEDLIADRMGQYASGTAPDRIDQARLLFALHPDVDRDYLDRRIKEETCGDHGIDDLTA